MRRAKKHSTAEDNRSAKVYSTGEVPFEDKPFAALLKLRSEAPELREPRRAQANTLVRENALARAELSVRREAAGRNGKIVTVVSGFPEKLREIEQIVSMLKRRLGTGGTVSQTGATVEIILQGDVRERIARELTTLGVRIKRSGGKSG